MVKIKRFPWSDSDGFLCVHYLDAYKPIQGEWALLQILSNLAYKNCFVYWTSGDISENPGWINALYV